MREFIARRGRSLFAKFTYKRVYQYISILPCVKKFEYFTYERVSAENDVIRRQKRFLILVKARI